MSTAILELREALSRRFPEAQPLAWGTAQAVPTGVAELNGLLPGHGLVHRWHVMARRAGDC
jgi:hypothetical protein